MGRGEVENPTATQITTHRRSTYAHDAHKGNKRHAIRWHVHMTAGTARSASGYPKILCWYLLVLVGYTRVPEAWGCTSHSMHVCMAADPRPLHLLESDPQAAQVHVSHWPDLAIRHVNVAYVSEFHEC
jgi:hypothetical protein